MLMVLLLPEVLQLAFKEHFSVDRKVASWKFLKADLNRKSDHHFLELADVLKALKSDSDAGRKLPCKFHPRAGGCTMPSSVSKTLDCLIIGFPCAPFSATRSERWKSGSAWQSQCAGVKSLAGKGREHHSSRHMLQLRFSFQLLTIAPCHPSLP